MQWDPSIFPGLCFSWHWKICLWYVLGKFCCKSVCGRGSQRFTVSPLLLCSFVSSLPSALVRLPCWTRKILLCCDSLAVCALAPCSSNPMGCNSGKLFSMVPWSNFRNYGNSRKWERKVLWCTLCSYSWADVRTAHAVVAIGHDAMAIPSSLLVRFFLGPCEIVGMCVVIPVFCCDGALTTVPSCSLRVRNYRGMSQDEGAKPCQVAQSCVHFSCDLRYLRRHISAQHGNALVGTRTVVSGCVFSLHC